MAVAGLSTKKAVVGVKLESSAYTWAKPTTAEDFYAYDITWAPTGDSYMRKEVRQFYGNLDPVAAPAEAKISFKALLIGSGTRGDAVKFHLQRALQACGMNVTATASTNIICKPVSTFDGASGNPGASYSIAVWEDGILYSIKGAMGTCKINCRVGEPVELEFNFQGAYMAPSADPLPTPASANLSVAVPASFLGAGVTTTVGGSSYSPFFESLSYDLNNTLAPIRNANDASGFLGYQLSDRSMQGAIDSYMVTQATYDWYLQWRNAATGAISTGNIGAVSGNIIVLAAPRCAYHKPPSPNDKNSMRGLNVDFLVSSLPTDAEGTEFTITIT